MNTPKRITHTRKLKDPVLKVAREVKLESLITQEVESVFIALPIGLSKNGKLVNRFNSHLRNIIKRECNYLEVESFKITCKLSEFEGKIGVNVTRK